MPVDEHQAQLANDNSKRGLEGKTGARIEISTGSAEDYEPQIALGDIFNPDWNEVLAGANEVQTLHIEDGWGGTFTITYDGETTAPIDFDASATDVEQAIADLDNVTPGDIRVSKAGTTADHTYTLAFSGEFARTDVAEITADATELASSAVVETVTEGDADPATNEVQTVTVSAAGGTFTLAGATDVTAALAYDISAAALKTALAATDDFEAADLTVTKSDNVFTITFGGALAATDVAELVADDALLTAPTVTEDTTTEGSAV